MPISVRGQRAAGPPYSTFDLRISNPMERTDPQYIDALRFLLDRINYERSDDRPYDAKSFRLARMAFLLERLGQPQRSAPVIHIAGTKGKGSVAWLVAEMLRHAGFRTGLYTSPHLEHLEERFVIDGRPVSPQDLVESMRRLQTACEACVASEHGTPTFFELTTALGWMLFQSANTHVNVIEVGLGGRLDSTNVCDPILSIITSISYDHQQQLGATLDKIAFEKAGIIKPGVPVIHGARAPLARDVIRNVAHQRGCELWELGRDFEATIRTQALALGSKSASSFEHDSPSQCLTFESRFPTIHPPSRSELPLRMLGRHQADNAAMAIAVWSKLRQDGWALPEEALLQSLAQTQVAARIESMPGNPMLILDAGHNEASIEALMQTLGECYLAQRRTLVFACSKDKKAHEMLERMLPQCDRMILTQFHSNPRALQVEKLEAIARSIASPIDTELAEILTAPDVATAIDYAARTAIDGELLCVTGSFFVAAEARMLCMQRRPAN
ncbi:MAG: bifunctional folylpolyglutamate synthase/dihydrofolate synthase [Pirellula sp.]